MMITYKDVCITPSCSYISFSLDSGLNQLAVYPALFCPFTSCSIPLFSPSYLLCRRLACGPPPLCYTYRRYDDLRKKEVDENQTMWTTVFAGWHIGQANRHTMNRDTHAALTDSFKSIRNVLVHLGACLDEWDPVLLGHLGTLFRCYFLRKSIVRKSFVWNIAFIRR